MLLYIGSFKLHKFNTSDGNFIQNEGNPLYALKGNSGNNFFAVSDLKNLGVKQIVVDGYKGSTKVSTITLAFSIVQSTLPFPSSKPSGKPSSKPIGKPSSKPSGKPISKPSGKPSSKPSARPITVPVPLPLPSSKPSSKPTSSMKPSGKPSSKPSGKPSSKPSDKPISKPSSRPSSRPSARSNIVPVSAPSPLGPNTFTGTFTLVRADMGTAATDAALFLGNYSNGATVNISAFAGQSFSLVVNFRCCFHSVVLNYTSVTPDSFVQTEGGAPYALKGNSQNNYNAAPDLGLNGQKRISVAGLNIASNVIATVVLNFNIVGGKPIPAPAPVAPPQSIPTTPAPVPQAPVPAELCTIPKVSRK